MVTIRQWVENNITHKEKHLKELTDKLLIERDDVKRLAVFAGIRFSESFLSELRELLHLVEKEEFEKATHDAIQKKHQYFADRATAQQIPRSETGLL